MTQTNFIEYVHFPQLYWEEEMTMTRRNAIGAIVSTAATAVPVIGLARNWGPDNNTPYPDPNVEYSDPRFFAIGPEVTGGIERLAYGFRFAEGPVWLGDTRQLLFTDIPSNKILRWTEETGAVSTFRHPSNHANGLGYDQQGRILACEHSGRRVTRTEHDGSITVIASEVDGKKFNSPNDIAVHPDGGLWFTDPKYGVNSNYIGRIGQSEVPMRVYRWDPQTGKTSVVADDPANPNGIAFSPDFKTLYVADSSFPQVPIFAYDVIDGKSLSNARPFMQEAIAVTDGICVDAQGNVWASAGWTGPDNNGVHVYTPEGELIGKIKLPEICANVCFGGQHRNRLFMTASKSLYSVFVHAQGAALP
jgi:gluconolactonase